MNLRTLFLFLIGNRQAIVDVATSRCALLLGGLFVLSAGFAREYDGEDLRAEPWHLLLPLGASQATSLILFCLLYGASRFRSETQLPFFATYGRFLTLYWMTAPLAWIYAIPVEQYLSPADGIRANLTMLAIVSLWRVLLITRCASVLFGSTYRGALMLVMLFADTLALIIVAYTPVPIFNIMGGIRLSESELVIRSAAHNVQFLGAVSWLIWFCGTLAVYNLEERSWKPLQFPTTQRVSRTLWGLAFASLVVWAFVLPHSQPPVALRAQVDCHLKEGRVPEAVALMSAHSRTDFPPQWNPRPRPGYGEDWPPLEMVLQVIQKDSAAPWVRELYFAKLEQLMDQGYHWSARFWMTLSDEEFSQYMQLLRDAPEMQELIRQNPEPLQQALSYLGPDPSRSTDAAGTAEMSADEIRDQERASAIRSALEFLEIPVLDSTAPTATNTAEVTAPEDAATSDGEPPTPSNESAPSSE